MTDQAREGTISGLVGTTNANSTDGDDGNNEQKQLSNNIILLDGGMGHQLRSMGITIEGEVGTLQRFLGVAMANILQPNLVRDAHLAFIDAGAQVITTNNYAVTPRVFDLCTKESNDNANEETLTLETMLIAACKAARDMRSTNTVPVKIAGCLPPLAESYQPDKVGTYDDNLYNYSKIVKQITPYCDILLCETLSTAEEAKAACMAASESGLPVWVSWTLDESKPVLRSGESLDQAVNAIRDIPNVQAYLINCTAPEIVNQAIPILRKLVISKHDNIRIGAYPNGFITAQRGTQGEYRHDLTDQEYYNTYVQQWITDGATIVGGCCGIFPYHIAYIKQQLLKKVIV